MIFGLPARPYTEARLATSFMYVAKILPLRLPRPAMFPLFGNHIGPGRIFARGIVEGYPIIRRLSIGHHKKFVAEYYRPPEKNHPKSPARSRK